MTAREKIFSKLPNLPAGMRWEIAYKRAWASLTLQRKRWWGWSTIYKTDLNPRGMGIEAAILSAADDIIERDTIVAT